jgi:hypothetical protein
VSLRRDTAPADHRPAPPGDPYAGPSDSRVAILIIGGIVVMFVVGVLLLIFAMMSDAT